MQLSTRPSAAGLEVSMRGRFTYADHHVFRELIGSFPDYRGRQVVLDLSELEFADSAAMGMLLLARDGASANGVDMRLRNAAGKVRALLDVARFHQLFSIE